MTDASDEFAPPGKGVLEGSVEERSCPSTERVESASATGLKGRRLFLTGRER